MYFLKTALKWMALAIVVLGTAAVLAASVYSHHGRKQLAKTKAELAAKGEKLTLSDLLPAPVPDALNIFEDPIWRATESQGEFHSNRLVATPLALADTPLSPDEIQQGKALFGPAVLLGQLPESRLHAVKDAIVETYPGGPNKDQALWILAAIRPFDPLLNRIRDLLDLPFARFRQNSNLLENEVYQCGGGLAMASDALSFRASANLALGNSEQTAADISSMGDLIIKTAGEPILYMEMIRSSVAAKIERLIREGIVRGAWSDDNLSSFETMLGKIDMIRGIACAFRAERGIYNQILGDIHAGRTRPNAVPPQFRAMPFGKDLFALYLRVFGAADQAALNRDIESVVEILESSGTSKFDEAAIRARLSPKKTGVLRNGFFSLLGGNVFLAAELQTSLDQTRIACALERFRLLRGFYPDKLSELVPQFLRSLPRDRYSPGPIKYALLAKDRFELSARSGEETIRWANFNPR